MLRIDSAQLGHKALLLAIVAVAVYLRFAGLDYMEFKGDEAFNWNKALEFVETGRPPLTSGVSSTGLREPPIFMYLLAIPLSISSEPVFACGFIALLNVIGLLLCYRLVARELGPRAALFAAALYAVSPWQVLFSRKIWTQNLLAPFVVGFLYCVVVTVSEKRWRYLPVCALLFGIVLQLHLSAAYVALVGVAILVRHGREMDWRWVAASAVVVLVLATPYSVHLIDTDFEDLRIIFGGEAGSRGVHLGALTLPFSLVSTTGFGYSLGADLAEFEDGFPRLWPVEVAPMVILGCAFLYWVIRRPSRLGWMLSLWVVLGVVYLLLTGDRRHYFQSLLPVFFIIMGGFLDRAAQRLGKWAGAVLTTLVVVICAYQLAFGARFIHYVRTEECIDGDYGLPFARRVAEIEDAVRDLDRPVRARDVAGIHARSCLCGRCAEGTTHLLLRRMGLWD